MGFFSKVKNLFSTKKEEEEVQELKEELLETIHEPTAEETLAELKEDLSELKEDIEELKEQAEEIIEDAKSMIGLTQDDLTLALRQTEQRLSAWLNVILDKVDEKGALLDDRLHFLMHSLQVPAGEAQNFIDDFNSWLARMDYHSLDDFRSELQYRLSLALDLEDEEDERDRLILKLNSSLTKTREQFTKGINILFSGHSALDASFWEELEELFIMSDMGYESAEKLCKGLKQTALTKNIQTPEELLPILEEEMTQLFAIPKRIETVNPPEVILMVGVNGVGKTTTIAKLAHRARMQGKKVLIAGADTFRAAAIEQLEVWAKRVNADFFAKQQGSDPAAVAYEAMDKALAGNYDIVFIDTAGRLHTKTGLMDELTKIRNVISKKHQGAPHRTILVIDATTGQNALQQTKLFTETSGVTEIILTKLDGTAKGGIALGIAAQFHTPITFIGMGEKLEDLRPFNPADFAKALFRNKE